MPAILAEMQNAYPLFPVHLYPYRPHKPLAFIRPIPGNLQIHMQAIKTERTVVTTAATGMPADFLSAFFADETLVVVDHVFSDVHNSYCWAYRGPDC